VLAAVLVLASVTDKLATFATNVVGDLGLPGIFLLMAPESACIPIPSEATMLFAGFNVHNGEYPLWAAVAVGVAGNVVGSWIAYAVGYYGRIELQWAERWFERYGSAAVFFSRMLPIIRTFISLPAGVARMPFWKFTAFTLAGCVPWVFMLTWIGREVGANWEDWKNSLHYVDYTVAALIVVGIGILVVRWRRNRGRTADATA
jgi:membrane protein DedA with SNARE-associated domain